MVGSYVFKRQQAYLDEIAQVLDAEIFRPSFFGKKNGSNTVLFYTHEDEAANRRVEEESLFDPKKLMPAFFVFENTDANGRISPSFANYGTLNLRGRRTRETLLQAVGSSYLKFMARRMANAYMAAKEGDVSAETCNLYARRIVSTMASIHGKAFCSSCDNTVLRPVHVDEITNFYCTFVVPYEDSVLNSLLADTSLDVPSRVYAVMNRVEEIGGVNLLWV